MSPNSPENTNELIDMRVFVQKMGRKNIGLVKYQVIQMPEKQEIELRIQKGHDTATRLVPAREYHITDLKESPPSYEKQYIKTTSSTKIQECSTVKRVNEVSVGLSGLYLENEREKRYSVIHPKQENLSLNILVEHNTITNKDKVGDLNVGVYRLQNVTACNTSMGIYLQSNRDTVIEKISERQYDAEFFIIGDTHIGFRNTPSRRYNCYKNNVHEKFNRLINDSISENIDAIIHTGDIYDSVPTDDDRKWMKNKLQELDDANIGFIYIRGNHDPKPEENFFSQLKNVQYIGTGERRQYAGFTFVGYDSDKISNSKNITFDSYNKKLIFIHPEEDDCQSIHSPVTPDPKCTRSAIFAGDCHTMGEREIENTPLIYTGSVTGLNHYKEPSFCRAKIWNEEAIYFQPESFK